MKQISELKDKLEKIKEQNKLILDRKKIKQQIKQEKKKNILLKMGLYKEKN